MPIVIGGGSGDGGGGGPDVPTVVATDVRPAVAYYAQLGHPMSVVTVLKYQDGTPVDLQGVTAKLRVYRSFGLPPVDIDAVPFAGRKPNDGRVTAELTVDHLEQIGPGEHRITWVLADHTYPHVEAGGAARLHVSARHGPAPWPYLAERTGVPSNKDLSIEVAWATDILHSLTGRQYGTHDVTFRPARQTTWPARAANWGPWPAGFAGGYWLYGATCGCAAGCSVCRNRLAVPKTTTHVHAVLIDGEPLDPAAYQLHPGWLDRIDGEAWPVANDLCLPATEPGTWAVLLTYGREVPPAGRLAVAVLAGEAWLAFHDPDRCRLPAGVKSLARQGVDLAMVDPLTLLDKGLTGLPEVDLWTTAVNPNRLRRRSRVHRADAPSRARARR